MNAIETIIASLNTTFEDVDAAALDRSIAWGEARRVAVAALRTELQPTRRTMGEFAFYDRLFAAAGGKTWFNVMNGADAASVEAFVRKNFANTIAKRNALIAKKLAAAGVVSIVSSEYARTNDGFNGCFVVETNAGKKSIFIQTIYAGGYNVQCLHIRTLVKVR